MTQSQFIQHLKQQPRIGNQPPKDGGFGDSIEGAVNAAADAVVKATQVFDVYGTSITKAVTALTNFNDSTNDYLTGLEKQMASQQAAGKAFIELSQRSLVLEKRNKELNKTFGIGVGAAQKMAAALNQNAQNMGISGKQAIKYATNIKSIVPVASTLVKKLGEGQGVQSDFFQQLTAVQDVITTNLGLSAEAAENFTYYASQQDANMATVLQGTQAVAERIEKATDMQGAFKDITEELGKASAATVLQFGRLPGNIELASLKSKALGLSLDEMTGIGKSMLDIESSIGSELEYQLLSGNRLVDLKSGKSLTNAFREAALAGDATAQADALNTILEQEGDVLENNLMAREQMSKLLGIDENKLARALQKKKLLEESGAEILMELSGGEMETAAKAMIKSGELTDAQYKELMELEDTRTTDDIMKEMLDVAIDSNSAAHLQNMLTMEAGKGVEANAKALKKGLEKQIKSMGGLDETKLKQLGGAIRSYEALTGAVATAKDAGLTGKYDTAMEADAKVVNDSLIMPGGNMTTAPYGQMFKPNPNDAIATGPPAALQAAANGGGGMDVTAFANAIVSAMQTATFAVDPGPVAYRLS
tara:strand:+ start:3861 stop:5636 length:1776 start_codon:yes stop_codon:yes gene_type:complete